jgi:antitoxin PrlF
MDKVTLSSRGVITIPASLRQAYGLKANDELILEGTEAGILLRPSIVVPLEIYTEARIAEFARDEAAVGKLLPRARMTNGRKR